MGIIGTTTAFNAAIAALIKNYGFVSTVHGLVETSYHAFSHTLMAGLSHLSGHGTLVVYGVARLLLLIPILIFSIVTCAEMLDRTGWLSLPIAWSAPAPCWWGPLLLGLWMFPAIYLIAESYTVVLGLFLLGLPLLFKTRLRVSDPR